MFIEFLSFVINIHLYVYIYISVIYIFIFHNINFFLVFGNSDFAYPTMKDRQMVILTKTIDALCRLVPDMEQKHGEVN